MANLQREFSEGQRAFDAGDHGEAAQRFATLLRDHPEQPAVHHLLGLSLKKQGKLEEARDIFAAAVARHPRTAGLHAELASLLDDLGDGEASIASYDRALALDPDMLDARIDRALVRHRHLDPVGGFEELSGLAHDNPASLRALMNVASLGRKLGRLREAEAAVEACLTLAPDDHKVLKLRAQVLHDLGKPASAAYRTARLATGDAEALATGEAAALLGEQRRAEAVALLERHSLHNPGSYDALRLLAQITWQSGAGEQFVRGYRAALQSRPRDLRLWKDLATVTGRALGYDRALAIIEEARRSIDAQDELDILEANFASEAGELDHAGALFARVAASGEKSHRLLRVRYLLKAHEFAQAQRLGLELVRDGLGPHAWPYVGIAWRMMDDPRWDWLEGDRDFPRCFDLADLEPELTAIAERLRSLHHWRIHPFEQSLRSGTQTDNSILGRHEPEFALLDREIRKAVRAFIDDLPPPEPDHPILSQRRESFYFASSWSIRLTDSGYHVSHVHSLGWISSVLYIALPPTLGKGGEDRDGWLVLGEPPDEFATGLAPLRMVEPRPARLVLFPSIMWHGTRPFPQGERLTVAFDVRTD